MTHRVGSDVDADFSKRDAFIGCRGKFDEVDEMQPCLDLLERHYLIQPKSDPEKRLGPGRKPSPVYEVNPRAFDARPHAHNSQNAQNSQRDARIVIGI